jgi:Na+-translocating ferredoxin:NAD+ oxidoreductase subunit B
VGKTINSLNSVNFYNTFILVKRSIRIRKTKQTMSQIEQIQAVLPQTQCTRCGFSGCLPYAKAIAEDGITHNRCHPGGDTVIIKLAQILNRSVIPMDPTIGSTALRQVALIDAQKCIGCTLCLPSCPVDAIVGGPKRLHTIDAERCTGCQLCIAPCPVDCITMVGPQSHLEGWNQTQRETAITDYSIALKRRTNTASPSISEIATSIEPESSATALAADKQNAAKAALAAALKKASI